jgi:hypothetical protein
VAKPKAEKFYEKTFIVRGVKNIKNNSNTTDSEKCAMSLEDIDSGALFKITETKLNFFKFRPGAKLTVKIFDEQTKIEDYQD